MIECLSGDQLLTKEPEVSENDIGYDISPVESIFNSFQLSFLEYNRYRIWTKGHSHRLLDPRVLGLFMSAVSCLSR